MVCYAAGFLAAIAASLVLPLEARAQTTTFVSNLGQADTTGTSQISATIPYAQQFETGSNSGGYTLTEIVVNIRTAETGTHGFALYTSTASDEPGTKVVDLSGNSSTAGAQSFTPASATTLSASTKYFIAFFMSSGTANLQTTNSNDIDSGASTGWDIAEGSLFSLNSGTSWTSSASSVEIAVKGTEIAAPGVTISKSALTMTEEQLTSTSYTVVLDTAPTASVTVAVSGHSGTDVLPSPDSLTFTTTNWNSAVTVALTAQDDSNTTNELVTLKHTATSTDSDYNGITIADVAVTVNDNDTAQVTGVTVAAGNAQLVVRWTAVSNATGYYVQWKSGSESYDISRRATISSGATTSHTISSLTNGTEYTVRVRALRTGFNNGPYSAEVTGTPAVPTAAGVTVSESALTVTEQDATGDTYTVVLDTAPTASVTVAVSGHASTDVTPSPDSLTFTTANWDTAQTVTVTANNDSDTTNDSVTLEHTATSTDSDYSGITIADVAVTVNDNDTARVTGVTVAAGNAQLAVEWNAVSNATGYHVQWKSGGQDFDSSRRATISSGATTSHTIPNLTNGTEYTVRVRATRTGANNGTFSAEVKGTPVAPTAAGVTVSESALTVTEEDATGDTYTVVLDTAPTESVTVAVSGHAGTDVTPSPDSLTFTTTNWDTAQTVTVTAGNDSDTTNDSVTLEHTATSTDSDYSGITIADVAVTVNDNDTARVTGVTVAAGNAQLVVNWTAVSNATGYHVQWKSGGQDYSSTRRATISSGTTTSHTIPNLSNGTEYTVQVRATRTGANDGAFSAEVKGTPVAPTAAGVTVSKSALTVTEEDTTGDTYTVVLDTAPTESVTVAVSGHAGTDVTPSPDSLTFTTTNWDRAQTVTVTAAADSDTTNDTVALTHTAVSTDTAYNGITIAGVAVTVKDTTGVPVMPTGLVVTARGDNTRDLAWNRPSSDGGSQITGYRIEVSTDGGASWSVLVGNTGTSTTTYSHTGLAPDTTYHYRVSAINAFGRGPFSNVGPPLSDDSDSSGLRNPQPLQLALWTDRPGYRAGETVRLYRTLDPHDDRARYRTFVYLEKAGGERRYLAPLYGEPTLRAEAVDSHAIPAAAATARSLSAAEKALVWEGPAPEVGLWQFVMDLRPTGVAGPDEEVDAQRLADRGVRRAWANFTVAEGSQLLGRGFVREVRTDLTLYSANLYYLGHQLFVHDGATLTIEAGTVVRAWGPHTAIIVEPGGRIVAEGTREAPVVLTCSSPVGQREPGCWAGLRILGKAPVTRLKGVAPGVLPAERPVYGGQEAEASAGVLRYVRVEFAGASGDPEVPGPAIGLYGAGSGTILDHVQARASLGDGFAFHGGAAVCGHCVASESGNAGLSWERGWRGGATHLYVQHSQGGVDGLAGANDDQGYDLEPRSLPTLSNVTLVHARPYGKRERRGVALRLSAGSGVRARDLLATRFGRAAIEARVRSALLFHEGESSVSGALFYLNGLHQLRGGIQDAVEFVSRQPKLHDVRDFPNPDPRPKADSPALPDAGEGYIGAFGRRENWLEEWTVFGPESVYDLRERGDE